MNQRFAAPLMCLMLLPFASFAGGSDVNERLDAATAVMKDTMAASDKGIPHDLLDKAHCVAVIPGMKKGAFLVGAQYGKGFLACRKKGAGGWNGPAALRVEGGNFGLQIGGGEVDVVLLIMNERGAENIMNNQFKIGGSASAMAGPVGRTVQAETDAFMRAEMLGYSRSRGVFAGIALEGSTLREDKGENSELYGKQLSNYDVLNTRPARSAKAGEFISTLTSYSRWEEK
jgi:lipid-binding SYLF domain-containing protein